jgi:hypothetical protein
MQIISPFKNSTTVFFRPSTGILTGFLPLESSSHSMQHESSSLSRLTPRVAYQRLLVTLHFGVKMRGISEKNNSERLKMTLLFSFDQCDYCHSEGASNDKSDR